MKIWELLNSKDKWVKGTFAEDKDGYTTDYDSPDAVRWCLIGAIWKCYPSPDGDIIINEIRDIIKKDIDVFNDTHSYKEIIKFIKELDI